MYLKNNEKTEERDTLKIKYVDIHTNTTQQKEFQFYYY